MKRTAALSEDTRQLVHVAFGLCAVLLYWLTWFEATMLASMAVAFNIFALHRLGGARLFRPDERGRRRVKSGIVLYPATIVCLLLLMPERPDAVAGAWGVLAFGDGMATLIGRRFPIRPLPWNPDKSVGGSLAFVLFGSVAASALLWWCGQRLVPPAYWWYPAVAGILGATIAAAVETIPISLDDNVTVAGSSAAVMWTLSFVSEGLLRDAVAGAPGVLPLAAGANAAVAALGYFARTVSLPGAVVGALLGTAIFAAAGWQGWVLLLSTFGAAVVTSRMGLARKTKLHIQEERGGRRGPWNALANTGVAAAAAVMGALSYAQDYAFLAFTAALVAGGSDTVASEIGKAWGRRTFLITTGKKVRPGTPGALSVEGTLAGLASAFVLAGAAAGLGLIDTGRILPVVGAATVGSLLESVLGATFEPQGIVNNDVLNFINTATAAYVAIKLAMFL